MTDEMTREERILEFLRVDDATGISVYLDIPFDLCVDACSLFRVKTEELRTLAQATESAGALEYVNRRLNSFQRSCVKSLILEKQRHE